MASIIGARVLDAPKVICLLVMVISSTHGNVMMSRGESSSRSEEMTAASHAERHAAASHSSSSSSSSSSHRSHVRVTGQQEAGHVNRQPDVPAVVVAAAQDRRGHLAKDASSSSSASAASSAQSDAAAAAAATSRSRSSMSELDKVSALASETEQRSYYKELFSRRCKDCAVKGQTYRGHSRFQYTEDCNKYRCICNCDGSYSCPPKYTVNVCKDGRVAPATGGDATGASAQVTRERERPRRRRCQDCEAYGKSFPGNAYFDVQEGCTKFRGCVCYCNGTWSCPAERAVDTCQREALAARRTSTAAPTCRACNAKGKVVEGNSYFELEEPCKKYRYCRCSCDGSWSCPEQYLEDTCKSASQEEEANPDCQKCDAEGKAVPGNTYFEMTSGCIEYKNCVCRCNGSWSCPQQYATNICDDQPGGRGSRRGSADRGSGGGRGGGGGSSSMTDTSSIAECQSCSVAEKYFRGNTYFSHRDGCVRYDRCVCRCDGSWDCPDRYVSDLCRDDDPSNDVPVDSCSFCDAKGQVVPSNTFFNMTDGCIQHEQCLCHCDGKWECPERHSVNTCEGGDIQAASLRDDDCGTCLVDSRVVRGNTYFDRITGCFKYRDCLCKCDGTFACQASRAENTCTSSNRTSSPTTSTTSTPAATCQRCFAYGQFYSPNTQFSREEGCLEYSCDCHCNGSYVCPAERTRDICETGCRECELGGQFFEGNTYFRHSQGCVDYLCTCYCNGSYVCPPERANNTCGGSSSSSTSSSSGSSSSSSSGVGGDAASRGTATDVGRLGRGGQCTQCVSNDGRSHAPNTDFSLQEGCIHYQCTCNCDGSWNCPGETARNVCRGEVLGGCRSCVISNSQIYRGDEDFAMREGCIHYECRCNCDGSWECPGEDARDICLGEVPGGCRVCRVSQNETYRGDTQFPLRQGCNHYTCNCHCNGSWECPGETARDTCIGEVPGGCRVCKLDNGEMHQGASDFQLTKDCIHYNCRCNCDGSWDCPGARARRVCNADGSPVQDRPQLSTRQPGRVPVQHSPRPSCRRCAVSDAEQFVPNAPFTLRRGCTEYQCTCACDGSWSCPGDQARDTCSGRREDAGLRAQSCQTCTVARDTYPGRSAFLLTRGCNQYSCTCDCQGRWFCNHTAVNNVCQDNDAASAAASDNARGSSSSGSNSIASSSSGARHSTSYTSVSSSASSQRGAQRGIMSNTGQQVTSTNRGSSVSAANMGSYRPVTPPRQTCRPCRINDVDYPPERDFVLDKKCKRFNCYCACNGRWRCPRERTEDTCPPDAAAAGSNYASSSSASRDSQSGYDARNNYATSQGQDGRRRTSYTQVRVGGAGSGSEGQRYGSTNIRVIGADTAASSSSSSSSHQGQGAASTNNVQGYYVDSRRQQPSGQQAGQNYRQQTGRQAGGSYQQTGYQAGQTGYQAGQTGYQVGHNGYQAGRSYGQAGYQAGQPTGPQPERIVDGMVQHSDQYYQDVAQNQMAAQRAAAARTSSSYTSDSAAQAGASQAAGSTCQQCLVDEKTYRAGAKFNWRRGCLIYKCHCLCSGSYRCGITVDSNCSESVAAGQRTGGLPTGPVSSGPSAREAGSSCGNCYVHGYVYPGNMSFTLRQGCQELSCRCACDGKHECSQEKAIPGCTAVSTPLAGAVYPHGASPALYPAGHGAGQTYAVRPGRLVSGYSQTFFNMASGGTNCASCGQGGAHAQGGYIMPAVMPQVPGHHPAQPEIHDAGPPRRAQPEAEVMGGGDQGHPQVQQTQPAQAGQRRTYTRGGGGSTMTTSQKVAMQRVETSAQDRTLMTKGDKACATCFVNGQSQRGSFEYTTRGCQHVTCMCDCSGWLRCSVQPARTAACPVQLGPLSSSGRCRSCVVEGQEYPPSQPNVPLQFALRVGCYGYDCSCGCDGLWVCPNQQPSNYCVLPADPQPPARLTDDDRFHVMAAEGRGQQQQHSNTRASLTDTSFSQDAGSGAAGEACRDCEVRGTTYGSRSDFLLKDGCLQHTCRCACDGSWACSKNDTVDVCQQEKENTDNEEAVRRTMAEKKRAMAEESARLARESSALSDADCRSCQVNGKNYLTESDFQYRRGCYQYTCRCSCNGTFACPDAKNVCDASESRDGCRQCQVGNKTYPGGAAFAYREGCWEFNCQCGCNGQSQCPPDRSRDMCNAGGAPAVGAGAGEGGVGAAAALRDGGGRREAAVASPRCKPCLVDGQVIRSRTPFNQKRGCREFLCQCECNGTWSCPAHLSYDTCTHDESQAPATQPRDASNNNAHGKGCTVGRKTYFSRLFAFVEGCVQHMCICYDNGAWRCPPGKERSIC